MSRLRLLPDRSPDPAESEDPAIVGLLAALAELDYAPAPRMEFREDLRRQLVAVTARIVAEGEPVAAVPAASAAAAAPGPRVVSSEVRRRRFARPMTVAASVVVLMGLLLSGAVWLSQRALPGDTLYGLKRADEDVRLSLTSGDTARGREYLSLAQTRVQEAQQLTGTPSALGDGPQAAGMSTGEAALISSTLASADSDLRSGSALLAQQAVSSGSPAALTVISSWAPGQLTRLRTLAASLPDGSLRTQAAAAWQLTDAALQRAGTLRSHVGQSCLHTSGVDSLGPLPCGAPTAPTSGSQAGSPGHVAPGSSSRSGGSSRSGSHNGSGTVTGVPGGTVSTGQGSGSGAAAGTDTPPLPTQLPTSVPTKLPTKLPTSGVSLPVALGTCGVSASAAGLGLGVDTCRTSH